ncbi:MAG: hypothetical protein Q4G35_09745 [Propionibacteriaceae bacterium]|nr:hypothetical protein [Propionibacteriaceae bacterium]
MTLLPYEATFPALGTRAMLLTSLPETLLPAVEVLRAALEAMDEEAGFDDRSMIAQQLADGLAEEFEGGFLVDVGGTPAVAGDSLAGTDPDIAELMGLTYAA